MWIFNSRSIIFKTLWVVIISLAFFAVNLFLVRYLDNSTPISQRLQGDEGTNEPKCSLSSALAKKALDRVKSETCRAKIVDAVCKLERGIFHEKFPSSTCSNHDDLLVGYRLGCFLDSSKQRVLDGHKYDLKETNSIELCRAKCYRAGFIYYGLEYGIECFCGNEMNGTVLSEGRCKEYSCPGNSDQTCGGFNAVEVFRTGLKDIPKIEKAKFVNETELDNGDVKILFLLQLNGRNDRQVKRMLKTIYSPRHLYYIHVDQRQLYMLTEMRKLAAILPNIYVSPDGHSTIWGGASLLTMLQDAIRRSLSLPEFSQWDYLINMSESDFPVMSLHQLEFILIANKGKSFLAGHGQNAANFVRKQGFDWVFVECENRMWRVGERTNFPDNLHIDGGSDWVVLHRDLAKYSISDEEFPSKLRKLFSSIILPVESFFHTLARNSPFCNEVLSGNLRLTNWNRKQGCRCESLKKVVDWCGCSPLFFQKAHMKKIAVEKAMAKPFYVARKFDSLVDIDAVSIAERQTLGLRYDMVQPMHPSYNSTFINLYKADIDGYSALYVLVARSLFLDSLAHGTFSSLLRIDVFKKNADAEHQIIITCKIVESDRPTQILVIPVSHNTIVSLAIVDGFQLKSVQFGVGLDHKEEIFRQTLGVADIRNSPVVLLKWKRLPAVTSSVVNKTSPNVHYTWRDGNGESVVTLSVKPYDSIWGSQFSTLDMEQYNGNNGVWSVIIKNPSTREVLAEIEFPMFAQEQTIDDTRLLTSRFYTILDACSEDCLLKEWSLDYPDPKSDIILGYDPKKDWIV